MEKDELREGKDEETTTFSIFKSTQYFEREELPTEEEGDRNRAGVGETNYFFCHFHLDLSYYVPAVH